MKLVAKFEIPSLNVKKLERTIATEFSDGITQAAFGWIDAALEKIPVWSGASHATFLHLARAVGFSLNIQPAGNAPTRIQYGLRASVGEVSIETGKGVFRFTYTTSLKHLVYNEYNNANVTPDPGLLSQLLEPGPYNFQDAARKVALDVLNNLSLPDVTEFISVKSKQVS